MFERVRQAVHAAAPAVPSTVARRSSARAIEIREPAPTVEVGSAGGALSPELATRIRSSGAGEPLPSTVREPMERALGTDLAAVRIHARSDVAPRLAASAFTLGHDIHFAPGQYRPETEQGRFTLAHELAHAVQRTSPAPRIQRKVGFEYEVGDFNTQAWGIRSDWVPHTKGFGSKVDPGSKPVFEFRSLSTVFGDELVAVVSDILGYLVHP